MRMMPAVIPLLCPQSFAMFTVIGLAALVHRSVDPCRADESSEVARPRLQIINGSKQAVEVFWLKSDTERVSNGTIAAGKNTIITTTIGHRFAIVASADKADKEEAVVTSHIPVQAYRFDPDGTDGVPAFYTQKTSAHGYPIVASANVNPYALHEAAYLVDLLLAKRGDVREAMIKSGSRLCILAWNEFTTDQPEFAWLADSPRHGISGKDYMVLALVA